MNLSAPVPSSSRKMMSSLYTGTKSLNLGSVLVIRRSDSPEAPNVNSDTLGTCCLKTRGVSLARPPGRPRPRPGPQVSPKPTNNSSSASSAVQRAAVQWRLIVTSSQLHCPRERR
ncbi:unnamed protein product, partial [Nesidiocoris tenuis]